MFKVALSTSDSLLAFILGVAVALVNIIRRMCVAPVAQPQGGVPASGVDSHRSA